MFESRTAIQAKSLTKLCTKEGFKRFVVFFFGSRRRDRIPELGERP